MEGGHQAVAEDVAAGFAGDNEDAFHKKRESSAFLKKSAQKTFAPGGAGSGIAFKRHLWRRLKAIPDPAPPGAKVFWLLFFKKVTAFFLFRQRWMASLRSQ
jgi:hypothetical protein